MLCCSYWNISSWLCGPQLLHPDSRDPSGAHRSVSAGAAEPADMKVESHQPSSTMFHTPALTGLPGGGRDKKKKKKKKKKKQHKQPWSCVPSQFISQAKSSWLSCGKEGERHLSLSGPVHPAGEWQHINKERPPSASCDAEPEQPGLSFTHLISQGVGHRPDRPR